ncbi:MAG: biotin--[acetyl-CoA-carboxylase] ligase [Desulfobacteraceae bacterium]|jgi:BirA family biotin operon repressor/biotin-[acetyl-CoA-carboxylase] ligase
MQNNPTKTSLLKKLKLARGEWVSGQMLSDALAISRTAVSKNIQTLRKEGYQIQAVTNKGYCLKALPDRLFKDEIQQGLSTMVFGRNEIFHYDTIASTNSKARELADGGADEGTLVIAECQSAGRGRRGRKWISPKHDGIYFSMIARPQLSPAEAPQITLLTAVTLARTIMRQTQLRLQIKWPNDLLIQGKKVAGILTELRTEMDLVEYVIIGIGLNVNTPATALEAIMDQKVTSLAQETNTSFSRLLLLQNFLAEFEKDYRLLGTSAFKNTLEQWRTLANIMGQFISVDVAGQTYRGRVVNIEKNGALVIEDTKGKRQRIFSGDLQLKKK